MNVVVSLEVVEAGGTRDVDEENTEEEAFPSSGMSAVQAANGVKVVGPEHPFILGLVPPVLVHDVRVLDGQVGMVWLP
jgi:hypothetical protein